MKTIKVTMGAATMAAMLAGCASYDSARTSNAQDIYREDFPYGQTFTLTPAQQRRATQISYGAPPVASGPRYEPVEISKTEQALAMRIRAARNYREDLEVQDQLAYVGPTGGQTPSGSVTVSIEREAAAAAAARAPVPVDYVGVQAVGLEPIAERVVTRPVYNSPIGLRTRRNMNLPPTASPVPGQVGYVRSPFAPSSGYIDVSGLPTGSQARDPYTGKVFTVP